MCHTAPVPMQPGTGLHARPMLSARAAKLPTFKAIPAATSTHTPSRKPALGEVLELECSRLALEGKGVCLLPPTNFVVLCTRALPGEKLRAQITAVKKGFAEARKLTTLVPHSNAVPAPCPHFGPCGGCSLQSLAYEAQLREKQNQVLQTLQRVGKLEGVDNVMKPILGCDASSSGETNSNTNIMSTGSNSSNGETNSSSSGKTSTNTNTNTTNTNIMSTGSNSSSGETNSSSSSNSSSSAGSGSGIYGYRNKMQFTFSSLCWDPDPPGDGPEAMHPQVDGTSAASPSLTPYAGRVVHRPVLGFLRPGSQTEVLPISRCWLQDETSNALLDAVRDLALKHGLLPFNDPSGKGFLKHLVIRSSRSALTPRHQHQQRVQQAATNRPMAQMQQGKEYLVTLTVTQEDAVGTLQPVADALVGQFPQVAGVVVKAAQSLQSPAKATTPKMSTGPQAGGKGRKKRGRALQGGKWSSSSVQQQGQGAPPDEEEPSGWAGRVSNIKLLAGSRPYLTETLSGVQLRVSPNSFLQTNTAQAEVLYKAVLDAAQLRPTDVLLDLYCGAGSIGLSLAHQCAHVVGFEAEGAAVKDAWQNAATNGVTNASFACVDLNAGVPNLAHLLGPPMQSPVPAPAPSTQAGHSTNVASVVPKESYSSSSSSSSSSRGVGWLDLQGLSRSAAQSSENTAAESDKESTHWGQSVARGSDARGGRCGQLGDGGAGVQGLTAVSRDGAKGGVSAQGLTAMGELGVQGPSGSDSCLSTERGVHTEGGVLSRRRLRMGPDVIVCDPARAGLSPGVVEYLLRSSARRVVYVSCNPATQARDLALLCKSDGGESYMRKHKTRGRARLDQTERTPFQLVAVRPVDMFPHTDHVETVAVLDRQQR